MVENSKLNDKKISQIFTPEYIADFMVRNILKLSNGNISLKDFQSTKVLEPCVGKGIFLKYLKKYGFKDIHAYEIDTSLRYYLLNKFPSVNIHFKNVLASSLDEKFELIIGNPPYLGQNYNSTLFQEYRIQFPICEKFFVGNMDLFYFFIHLGIEKLKPGGLLSFITTKYWITKSNRTGIKFLKPHILSKCFLVQYIDLSPIKVFESAQGQANCIFVLKKKTDEEIRQNIDHKIEIIQIQNDIKNSEKSKLTHQALFDSILNEEPSKYYIQYVSAITNHDLKPFRSWNLLLPSEVEKVVKKIETKCKRKENILYLKDLFVIRNGLIFIKDDIFILKEDENIKFQKGEIFLKVRDNQYKLNSQEKERLKKIYKSKTVMKFGYQENDYLGYSIYFNKSSHHEDDFKSNLNYFKKNFPTLTKYLLNYESELRDILTNANENPDNIFYPRRGDRIKIKNMAENNNLIDLEPQYEHSEKIFFPYISDSNVFGYSKEAYFATSDTYFLWSKNSDVEISYPFLVAYLNSKIVSFLFKARNIEIKRSKTKLENNIPIPNVGSLLKTQKSKIIDLITDLSNIIIELRKSNLNKLDSSLIKKALTPLDNSRFKSSLKSDGRVQPFMELEELLELINQLFFMIFEIDEKSLDDLIRKYY